VSVSPFLVSPQPTGEECQRSMSAESPVGCLLTPSQHQILEKLLRDVFSLLAIDRNTFADPLPDASFPRAHSAQLGDSLHSLSHYFFSDEFVELAMESLNFFLFFSFDPETVSASTASTCPSSRARCRRRASGVLIPSHHTALELCLQHSVDLMASQDMTENHRGGALKSLRTQKNLSADYNLHPVVWSERTEERDTQTKGPSRAEVTSSQRV
jgi:hypothetical protein